MLKKKYLLKILSTADSAQGSYYKKPLTVLLLDHNTWDSQENYKMLT